VRVPFADVGAFKIPDELSDDQALFLTDILPTGFMAAENANIQRGDTVAIWGCGPVGQFTIQSAFWHGAERVIAIDHIPERLKMARTHGNAETLNYSEVNVLEALHEMTGGIGPDACIDCVGLEVDRTGLFHEAHFPDSFHYKCTHHFRHSIPCHFRRALNESLERSLISVNALRVGDNIGWGHLITK
jgi:threonine dehydrogenase-like Zn-dependent dehydrogenase